jgi:hypothetical protein
MRQGRLFSLAVLLLGLMVPASVFGAGPNWELVEDDDGIKVWSLQIPGQDLPGFRGITTMKASIDELLKVMLDFSSHTEWMWRSRESKLVKQITETRGILYNRIHAPWPVKDRDLVLDTDYRFTPDHKALTIRFTNTKDDALPVRKGIVRVPRINGFYRFWTEDGKTTNVLYQVEVDIGGNVPDFAARRYARKLPFNTLESLRERVEAR